MRKLLYLVPKSKAKGIMEDAFKLAKSVAADQLDCSISFCREPTDKTPEEVFDLILKDKSQFWNFIERDGYGKQDYFDVGGSTMTGKPTYFLWLKLSIADGEKLIEKYNLQPF